MIKMMNEGEKPNLLKQESYVVAFRWGKKKKVPNVVNSKSYATSKMFQ